MSLLQALVSELSGLLFAFACLVGIVAANNLLSLHLEGEAGSRLAMLELAGL